MATSTKTRIKKTGVCGYNREKALMMVREWEKKTGEQADIQYTGPCHHASGVYHVIEGNIMRFCRGVIGDKEKFASEC